MVRELKKAGSLEDDKVLECAKMESAMAKSAKRNNARGGNQLASLTDLQNSSKARELENDKNWNDESTEVVQRKQDLERHAEFKLWNALTGKEGF